jgi:hypothetical protein
MGDRFQALKTQEAAGTLDGVDKAEDIVERLAVVGVGFEPYEFAIDDFQAFGRFGQEFSN